ncbi:hypothetical protein BDZ45DRAFT_744561 [Acephala macrosclerotiorum]|nr:hypothetical protein BDZ45DRAFT_744561 [Acephala macrosclerotiorum]
MIQGRQLTVEPRYPDTEKDKTKSRTHTSCSLSSSWSSWWCRCMALVATRNVDLLKIWETGARSAQSQTWPPAKATPKKPAAKKPAQVKKAPAAESIAGPSSSKPSRAKKDQEVIIKDPEIKYRSRVSKDIPNPTKKDHSRESSAHHEAHWGPLEQARKAVVLGVTSVLLAKEAKCEIATTRSGYFSDEVGRTIIDEYSYLDSHLVSAVELPKACCKWVLFATPRQVGFDDVKAMVTSSVERAIKVEVRWRGKLSAPQPFYTSQTASNNSQQTIGRWIFVYCIVSVLCICVL